MQKVLWYLKKKCHANLTNSQFTPSGWNFYVSLETERPDILRKSLNEESEMIPQYTKNHDAHFEMWAFSEVWSINFVWMFRVDVSNQRPSNQSVYYQDESNWWYLQGLLETLSICFPGHHLGHLRQLCATLYGWHRCTLCHQGLACGGVKWKLSCSKRGSHWKTSTVLQ